ncbi:MAG: hypothetical protein A2W97_05395 [Bacteroidetes bacterium GWE2_40_63]|nr:MAG: hypothetical protein A2W84_00845 [Bacteroidetes bacterium GWC2_40_13]OFX74154.1 MAG: hypothetical protein A2W96_12680 [Bacteroidetes bacterium GWD2_40_43]OFX93012.1 MAG: hypothetical protein A2W97_05395 [Bacteroidetes bacterium GWE2_40_63]OFY21381.1 MAG: hypothetical protein A2W88_09390 [Bacteroidetes bacterium GWF2_40_13]HBX85610.1 hypothetical protein [Marinilabiliales bacterium]
MQSFFNHHIIIPRTFIGAGAEKEKHMFGSEKTVAGMGCLTLTFVYRGIFILFLQLVSMQLPKCFRLIANYLIIINLINLLTKY